MPDNFELLAPTDKPALLGCTNPEWLTAARTALEALHYKVHTAADAQDFTLRFSRVQYQVVLLEEQFAIAEHNLLREFQQMPMSRRRHATFFLVGDAFQTLNALQAFQQSVHAVIGQKEITHLQPVIEKTVADNQAFLRDFRETQARVFTRGKRPGKGN